MPCFHILRSGVNVNQEEEVVSLTLFPLNFETKEEAEEYCKNTFTCYENQRIFCKTEEELSSDERRICNKPRPIPQKGKVFRVYRHGENGKNQAGVDILFLCELKAKDAQEAESLVRERYEVWEGQWLEVVHVKKQKQKQRISGLLRYI